MRNHSGRAAALVGPVLAGVLTIPAPPAAAVRLPADAVPASGPGTTCQVERYAGTAVATCHNPDARVAFVQLHLTCERWWDPATDSAPRAVDPAQWVTLTGRCWKEIRAVRVTRR